MTDVKLKLLTAKSENLFGKVQSTYDLLKKLSVDKTLKPSFLSKVSLIDAYHQEYKEVINQLEELRVFQNEDYIPDYSKLDAFEELVGIIKYNAKKCESTSSSGSDKVSPELPKLPPLDLPYFDGNIQRWSLFSETFTSLIHTNKSLSDDQKIHYLVSRLKGSALSVCSGIPAVGSNYQTIWQALKDRYEDKRAMAGSYMDSILDFKHIRSESIEMYQKFIDEVGMSVLALKALKLPDLAEYILYALSVKKLDTELCRKFEAKVFDSQSMPQFTDLLAFVNEQVRILERMHGCSSQVKEPLKKGPHTIPPPLSKNRSPYKAFTLVSSEEKKACPACKSATHLIFRCPSFVALDTAARVDFVKANNLCFNCLGSNHQVSTCSSKSGCKKCGYKHNTLLHLESYGENASAPPPPPVPQQSPSSSNDTSAPVLCASSHLTKPMASTTVLLSTVQVYVKNVLVRMLLDSASMSNFITQACCKKLGIKYSPLVTDVGGIGGMNSQAKGVTSFSITSRFDASKVFKVDALVVEKITDQLPVCPVDTSKLSYVNQAMLSDGTFHIPGNIDGLIGVKLFSRIIGKKKFDQAQPILMESELGDILMGKVPALTYSEIDLNFCAFTETPLASILQKFWTIEEVPPPPQPLSYEDKICEEKFVSTHRRMDNGRYSVSLPFKANPNILGNSYDIAKKRLVSLERKFSHNNELKQSYTAAISEYITQGHAVLKDDHKNDTVAYYMPHHAVSKPDRLTTKVRVVFDLSCSTSSGLSLNDVMYTGPTLYKDLFKLLISFRMFPIACTADIKKMFLQVYVHEEDRKFQRFLWRNSPQEEIQCYEMERVVFGNKASPYLAQRMLAQLASDSSAQHPLAAQETQQFFYMDDYLTSFLEEEVAVSTQADLIAMFQKGGFELTKFATNNKVVLDSIPPSHQLMSNVEWDSDSHLKILGIQWNPNNDYFSFTVNVFETKCTKRIILSTVARIFDILGFVSPITINMKLLIKDLWTSKVDWDETPPLLIQERWSQIVSELPVLNTLKIPRHLSIQIHSSLSLVGFCDASERAMGACVYVHVVHPDNSTHVHLACAKSKVAPMKYVTIPRLELCAALLLSKLLLVVTEIFAARYDIRNIFCFTDSTVALSWIISEPFKWNTFVANRVSKIQEVVHQDNWYHVQGVENPADVLSRGTSPSELVGNNLYWNGPPWVKQPTDQWELSRYVPSSDSVPEERKKATLHSVSKEKVSNILLDLTGRISSWKKLLRAVAMVLKFCRLLPIGPCTVSEHDHPLRSHHIVDSLIDYIHVKNCHSGPHLVISISHKKYWILGHQDFVHKRIQKCTVCSTGNPKPTFPIMSNLPSLRLQDSQAFHDVQVVQVALTKTSGGVCKRPAVKLCPHPNRWIWFSYETGCFMVGRMSQPASSVTGLLPSFPFCSQHYVRSLRFFPSFVQFKIRLR
ncbi:hypothetical protein M8J77_024772 [Diaphorina citri]|nr:hypothetical protein M8J77_024772 [Diaphorina citri]